VTNIQYYETDLHKLASFVLRFRLSRNVGSEKIFAVKKNKKLNISDDVKRKKTSHLNFYLINLQY